MEIHVLPWDAAAAISLEGAFVRNPDLRPVPGYSRTSAGKVGRTWYDDEGWWGVAQFDAFLRREVPKIEASPAFGATGVIFITYDEGADKPYPNRFNILLDVVGPQSDVLHADLAGLERLQAVDAPQQRTLAAA